ncbi:hypothetical protein ABE504_14235 [Paenibacillus oryzisoli]|uniref:hypothetical protein n=1 Tax=Paenibacillus oryzisoli TaxID=1850517 RepID=UPI003D287A5D
MTRKILPMGLHDYRTYPNCSNLFSMIINHEETLPWISNNFIQVVYFSSLQKLDYINKTECFYDPIMFDCPWLNIQSTHRGFIAHKWEGSIVNFVMDNIDSGYYVYFLADQFYISESDSYQKNEHNHDMFVYGYDKELRRLYIADNMKQGKYIQTTCSFEEMEQAYKNADLSKDWFDRRVFSFSYKKDHFSVYQKYLNFDTRFVVDSISRYINSVTPDLDICQENIYGIKVYEAMQDYLTRMSTGEVELDLRPIYFLHEHKKLMLLRMQYMLNNGYLRNQEIYERYEEIKKIHEVCLGLLMKFIYARQEALILKVKDFLILSVAKEKEILSDLIADAVGAT